MERGGGRPAERGAAVEARLPLRLAHQAAQLQWRLLLLPWALFLGGASACAALLVRFLVAAGVPPSDYADKTKVRELSSVIEHMHQREDAYRRKLKELQEECEVRLKDKKKALIKLQKARLQVTALHAQLGEETLAGSPHASDGEPPPPRLRATPWGAPWGRGCRLSMFAVHASMVAASTAALWLFRQEHVPVISRKTCSSIAFPMWFFWGWLLFLRPPPALGSGLFCAGAFLSGFVACQWMAGYSL